MSIYWKRSHITKVLADAARVGSFSEAEARLNSIQLDVVVGDDQLGTPAGQAAALTAVATARKCFGRVTIVAERDAPADRGATARQDVVERRAAPRSPRGHEMAGGGDAHYPDRQHADTGGLESACWWDRWPAGTRAFDDDGPGVSRLALAGIFAGALAVRQVFVCVVANRNVPPRDATVSLPASAWRWWPTPRSPASAWRGNWTG